MFAKRFALVLVAVLTASILLAPTASAHKTSYSADGNIKIVWGFLNEPAATWTKTGIDLILSDNLTGAPITGAADTVEAHLQKGDAELHLEELAGQFGKPGSYTQVVTLTQPGLYSLQLHGTINGSEVDMTIPAAHEIRGLDETYFPDPAEDPFAAGEDSDDAALDATIAALAARITALEAKAATQSTTPATLTPQVTGSAPAPGLGVLAAIAAVGVAFLLIRRKA